MQVSTGNDYANAMDRLLGKIQALELENARSRGEELSPLIDGRIHYRNFFKFCQPEWIRPTNILKLIQEEESVNIMKHMLDAYKLLLEHIADFVVSPRGSNMFIPDQPMNDLPDSERKGLIIRRKKEGNREMTNFKQQLLLLKESLKSKQHHRSWEAESSGQRKRREEMLEVLLGKTLPNPEVAIPKFFNHEAVRNLERLLIDVAARQVQPTLEIIKKLANFLSLKIGAKAGNRPEALANLTMKLWF